MIKHPLIFSTFCPKFSAHMPGSQSSTKSQWCGNIQHSPLQQYNVMQNSTNAVQPPSSQILYQGMETKFIGSPQKTYHYWVFHLCHFAKSDSTKTIKNSDMENRRLFYSHYYWTILQWDWWVLFVRVSKLQQRFFKDINDQLLRGKAINLASVVQNQL